MDEFILKIVNNIPLPFLFVIIAVALVTLSKGADILVDEAVSLSVRWKIPKVVIGATIVSIGTTLPEASVSVAAAVGGNPGMALGNAVGSIICDTALIIGLATLIKPLPLDKSVTNRQGWFQPLAGLLLVAFAIPWLNLDTLFTKPGSIDQWVGFMFVALLIAYLVYTMKFIKKDDVDTEISDMEHIDTGSSILLFLKLVAGIALVIVSSKILIPTVEVTAGKIGIPDSIIAATIVAFGTSLPELVTAITAVRKGHGELAVGNIIGADILNVLFVVGLSAAVTKGGLQVPPFFFYFQFPIMLAVLAIFRSVTLVAKKTISRWVGIVLLLFYGAYLTISYII